MGGSGPAPGLMAIGSGRGRVVSAGAACFPLLMAAGPWRGALLGFAGLTCPGRCGCRGAVEDVLAGVRQGCEQGVRLGGQGVLLGPAGAVDPPHLAVAAPVRE